MSNTINKAIKCKKYMTKRSKKMLMMSHVLSKIKYNAPLLAGETDEVKERIYKVIHKAARFVKNVFCYMQSIKNIMTSLEWKLPAEVVDEASAKFTHRIIKSEEPKILFNKTKAPRSRQAADHTLNEVPKTNRLERTPLHIGMKNFNRMTLAMKQATPRKLTKIMKKQKLKEPKKK